MKLMYNQQCLTQYRYRREGQLGDDSSSASLTVVQTSYEPHGKSIQVYFLYFALRIFTAQGNSWKEPAVNHFEK